MVKVLLNKGVIIPSGTKVDIEAHCYDEMMHLIRQPNKTNQLIVVMEEENWENVYSLLKSSDDINFNIIGRDGLTPLMYASMFGHTDIVQKLTKKDIDLEMKDQYGWTALKWAVANNHTDTMKVLIKAKADINTVDTIGETPLIFAAKGALLTPLELLLKAGADTTVRLANGYNALMMAIDNCRVGVVELFAKYVEPHILHERRNILSLISNKIEAIEGIPFDDKKYLGLRRLAKPYQRYRKLTRAELEEVRRFEKIAELLFDITHEKIAINERLHREKLSPFARNI